MLSKSIGKPVNKSHVFLSNDYNDYFFNEEISRTYSNLLKSLKSDCAFSSSSLSHNIDGLIVKHPLLHNRIVEFDEEQHFTPARKETLEKFSTVNNNNYTDQYLNICNNLNYVNEEVLRKHRINNRLEKIPKNFKEFLVWLESINQKPSGYILSKKGFPFPGGRIAQRAYYDCLRDTAHFSKKNEGLSSPLRFAKKNFEDEAKTKFKFIPLERLQQQILNQLKNVYQLEFT